MSAWKKKEKALSPEEAIALAKSELAPFWFNSEPYLASFKTDAGASVLPLNSEFSKLPWLFFFLDPAEYSGETTFAYVYEWYRRYHAHKLGMIVFLKPSPVGALGGQELVKKFQIQCPVVVDQESLFAEAFGIKDYPGFVVLNGATEVARAQGVDKMVADHFEEKIQIFLRKTDPGLSLPLSFEHEGTSPTGRIDFGSLAKPSSQVQVAGTWTQGEDFIRTQDPQASLEVTGNGSWISLVARSGLDTQPSSVRIDPTEGSLGDDVLADGVFVAEGGAAFGKIQSIALYHLLNGLSAGRRKVKLSFPDADRIPVILYGLRFGD